MEKYYDPEGLGTCFVREVESFQILKVEDKEENFSFMEKESHNTIKNSMEQYGIVWNS